RPHVHLRADAHAGLDDRRGLREPQRAGGAIERLRVPGRPVVLELHAVGRGVLRQAAAEALRDRPLMATDVAAPGPPAPGAAPSRNGHTEAPRTWRLSDRIALGLCWPAAIPLCLIAPPSVLSTHYLAP